ncbi:MAG: hypothetical protein CMO46_05755 [Verrucomicrobiales bacterium]|nr:hypothetical protein [Verrucomicrobiales bacterium]
MQQEKNPTISIKKIFCSCTIILGLGFVISFVLSCSNNKDKEIKVEKPSYQDPDKRTSEISKGSKISWDEIDNPVKDGWSSEKLASIASEGLKEVRKSIQGESNNKIEETLSSNIIFTDFHEKKLKKTFESEEFVIWSQPKIQQEINSGKNNFLDLIKRNYAYESDIIQTNFKVVSVNKVAPGFITKVLSSISFLSSEQVVDERSQWEVHWDNASLQKPKITKIEIHDLERTKRKSSKNIFSDCTESLLSSNDSYQDQISKGINYWLDRLPAHAMLNRFGTPGIAIGDINSDGLEDLYLCQEPGLPNKLFIQKDDGTLDDQSEKFGLDWLEDSRSSLIIDLDNDGHRDIAVAMFGFVLIAKNQGFDKGFQIVEIIPTSESTSSLAAADFDLDGRLDIYVCCYAPNKASDPEESLVMGGASRRFIYHDDNNGPKNYMLKNVTTSDGKISFKDVTEEVGLNKNNNRWSFAASWEDFDNDGDPDLYVANDYGKNNLYQNELGSFQDITENQGVEDSASGMSVSWGDYNLDGRMDLYISNMFSSAGTRITNQKKFKPTTNLKIKNRFKRFARGNTLFNNTADGFTDNSIASGVTMGRWAWGSKFIDFNNDGWEDIVIANGYLTSDEDDTGDL